jgi:D-alanine-D-alanine ligase
MKKILILFGGNSHEHSISCKSAKTILENIDNKKFETTAVGIYQNNWYIFKDNLDHLENNTWLESNITKIDNIINFIKIFDKVFPIIHGNDGETGALSGLLNLFNIPYVGSNIHGHATSYDKETAKIICNYHNIPQIPYITIHNNKKIKKLNIAFPVIVKPSSCGSSIGINIANNIKELNKHIKVAFKYDNKVIIEKFIKAKELECAILNDKKIITSTIGEIKSTNTFYDYNSKYILNSKLIIPAKIDKELIKQIQAYSIKIFKILSLKDLSRIDFLYDYENNKLYFNEVNTIPGFTSISMYPQLFNHQGISTKELITKLLS